MDGAGAAAGVGLPRDGTIEGEVDFVGGGAMPVAEQAAAVVVGQSGAGDGGQGLG